MYWRMKRRSLQSICVQVPCLQAGPQSVARAVLCVDDDKDACAIAEANKTDGDGLVVLNEKIKDEAHATRLLAEEYGGPADAILADIIDYGKDLLQYLHFKA